MLLITVDLLKKAGRGHYTQVIKNNPLRSGYTNTIQRYKFQQIFVEHVKRELQFQQHKSHMKWSQLQLPQTLVRKLLLTLNSNSDKAINTKWITQRKSTDKRELVEEKKRVKHFLDNYFQQLKQPLGFTRFPEWIPLVPF